MDCETWKGKHSKDDVIKLLMSKGLSYAKALECSNTYGRTPVAIVEKDTKLVPVQSWEILYVHFI